MRQCKTSITAAAIRGQFLTEGIALTVLGGILAAAASLHSVPALSYE